MAWVPTAPGDFANPDGLDGCRQSLALAVHFVPPQGQLQAHGHGFGMDPVGAAHHQRVLVFQRLTGEGGYGLVQALPASRPPASTSCKSRPVSSMSLEVRPRCSQRPSGPKGSGDGRDEGRYVVAGSLKYLVHSLRVILGVAQEGHVLGGDYALLAPGLADGQFDGQPFFVLVVVGPHPLHGGTGISVYHSLG